MRMEQRGVKNSEVGKAYLTSDLLPNILRLEPLNPGPVNLEPLNETSLNDDWRLTNCGCRFALLILTNR